MNKRLNPEVKEETVRKLAGPFSKVKVNGHRVQVSVESHLCTSMRAYLYNHLPIGAEVYVAGDYPRYKVFFRKLFYRLIGV